MLNKKSIVSTICTANKLYSHRGHVGIKARRGWQGATAAHIGVKFETRVLVRTVSAIWYPSLVLIIISKWLHCEYFQRGVKRWISRAWWR